MGHNPFRGVVDHNPFTGVVDHNPLTDVVEHNPFIGVVDHSGSWVDYAVTKRIFLGFILDLFDVFIVNFCSARAEIQSQVSNK